LLEIKREANKKVPVTVNAPQVYILASCAYSANIGRDTIKRQR
jgi:hypothetical protein